VVSEKWGRDNGGAIPPNLIEASNTRSTDPYIVACRERGLEVHPARFSEKVPEFFISFLTRPGDLVLDPFAGSNMVGGVAEKLRRRWIAVEIKQQYVMGSEFRFRQTSAGRPSLPSAVNGRLGGRSARVKRNGREKSAK
jgi:site-specific DNA-methyltransferase (cytosine-N4-specific)